MNAALVLFVAGCIFLVVGIMLWQRQKKKGIAPTSLGMTTRSMQILERDYYRLYMECSNCGYICGTYIKRGTSLDDTTCSNCAVKGKCKPAHYKDYKGVDVVIPDLPQEVVVEAPVRVIKSKSKMW